MFSNKSSTGTVKFKFISLALLVLFYLGIAMVDGPEWCVDTYSYVTMDFSREPVYPLFLLGLRCLFEILHITAKPYGLPAYLTAAVIIQSLLWSFAAYYLGAFILDATRSLGNKKSLCLSAMAMLFQIGVAGINRFVAKRGSMYSESLMTEALAMPLYVIFTIVLIKSIDNYAGRSICKLFALGVIICSIRKQMLIVLITWGFVSFVYHLFVKKSRNLKKFILTCILLILAYASIIFVDEVYENLDRGVFTTHIGNSKGGLDTMMYTASLEDADVFADIDSEKYPEIEDLYIKIYDACREQELMIDFAPGYELKENSNVFNSDWPAMVDHYAECYDVIGFDIVGPILQTYVLCYYPELDDVHSMMMQDEVEGLLFKKLLKNKIGKVLNGTDKGAVYVFTANVLKAFVISNANMLPKVLIKISAVLYAVFLIVFIAVLLKKNTPIRSFTLRLMFIVMAGIAINCFITGALIFPQPRYMCYGMGLFYLALLLGIVVLIPDKRTDCK
ncbi:hypothetical protein [Butyrivibrio fibrisolvens]|uniref:Uncharacterized protein n=1 Tax=Butyrivibrio fibrisolvens TaxID=831 RepID=A0A317FYI4_BUTFI|nr:hypothetical protein [Butyrivibrio fibrisolvens]PWT26297.1 hypothetical protein CPT75_03750 [Butyrivibrio fibrisolvens]